MSAGPRFSSDPPALDLRLEHDDARVVVAAAGELDITTVDGVGAEVLALAARGCPSIVLDLGGLTFADSCLIHLLLELEAAAAIDGFAFAVRVGDATPARRLLELTGLAERFCSA